MTTKAERTTAYIIKTVAPIFNKHGYIGTSMSDLTKATGLTKGALYGNFKNKEELSLVAFEYNSTKLLKSIDEKLNTEDNSLEKLFALTNFYRKYDIYTLEMGGCPVLKVGVDAQYNNELLKNAVKKTIKTIEEKIAIVVENGVNSNEITLPVTPLQFAKQFYTMIQGGVAMATTTGDRKYLLNTIAYLEQLVQKEITSKKILIEN